MLDWWMDLHSATCQWTLLIWKFLSNLVRLSTVISLVCHFFHCISLHLQFVWEKNDLVCFSDTVLYTIAAKILTLIKKRHLLLCTLVISKAFAVEVWWNLSFPFPLLVFSWFKFLFLVFPLQALPIFIHRLVPETSTILISTAVILIFTDVSFFANLMYIYIYLYILFVVEIKRVHSYWMQIIPHSICSHYGLLIGSVIAPAIRLLVWICFPVAYPISKVLLSFIQEMQFFC